MPTPAALLLTAATGSAALSVGVAAVGPRAPSLHLRSASATRRAPGRARPTRIRAAAAIGGEFGGLAQRRALAGEFIERLRNVLPGGSWWRLEDGEEAGGGRAEASGATAASALRRMWALVASDRWVVFVGFASLVGAAVMAISGFDLCCCRVLVDGSNAVTCGCGCSSRRSRYPISSQRPSSRRRTEGLCSTGTLSFWLFCV